MPSGRATSATSRTCATRASRHAATVSRGAPENSNCPPGLNRGIRSPSRSSQTMCSCSRVAAKPDAPPGAPAPLRFRPGPGREPAPRRPAPRASPAPGRRGTARAVSPRLESDRMDIPRRTATRAAKANGRIMFRQCASRRSPSRHLSESPSRSPRFGRFLTGSLDREALMDPERARPATRPLPGVVGQHARLRRRGPGVPRDEPARPARDRRRARRLLRQLPRADGRARGADHRRR